MDKIKWCAGKKEGLSLIEPNSNLAEAYIKKAEEALEAELSTGVSAPVA